MTDDLPTYADASTELVSAMQAVDDAAAAFFKQMTLAMPLFIDWEEKRKMRDRLKDQFRTRFHQVR